MNKMSLEEEWNSLKFESQMRLPLTANIPYYFRWKIMNLKLMLNDLVYLEEKYDIKVACDFYGIVAQEAEEVIGRMLKHIKQKREWRIPKR